MNTLTSLLVASLCITCVLANPVKQEEGEVRTIYTSGSGTYLGLNSTILWVAVLGIAAIALLASVGGLAFLGVDGGAASSGYQQRYTNYANDQYGYDQHQHYHTKRSVDENMVTKMLQLEQVFKKYEVEEDECRAYVACEAANVERLIENGPLVQQVHEFFNSINHEKPEHLAKMTPGVAMMKHAYDSAKLRQRETDVCKPLREACQGRRQH